VVLVQRGFRCAIAALALIDFWVCRYSMNPDGISYLDMGDLYWKGNWHSALNSYWSPLYSWLTGLLFLVTRPSMRWEFPEVHLLNFAIFVATLFCFEFFWRELLAYRNDKTWTGASEPYVWVLGYLAFLGIHFGVDSVEQVTPDLLVAALVYVASGMMLRFAGGRMGTASAGLFGVELGVGYLAKAVMLPFAAFAMTTMLAVAWKKNGKTRLIGAALLGFLAVSMPFVAALSWNQHRFTFGDAGKVNQGWLDNSVEPPYRHWQGSKPGHLDALHPTRMIFSWPAVYEFATPIAGTYPVWYDPSYWYAGLDTSVHPAREIRGFVREAPKMAFYYFFLEGILTAVPLVMFFLSDRIGEAWRRLMRFWPALIPAVATISMYSLVHFEPRLTSGVVLVVWGAVLASTSIAKEERRLKVTRVSSLVLGLWVIYSVLSALVQSDGKSAEQSQQVVVADRLRTMGIEPGDHVASIGNSYYAYWARLEKVEIVSEVPRGINSEIADSASAFWRSSPEGKEAVLHILRSTGAKAVISDSAPAALPPGWIPIENTKHAVYFFR
jgi:hypothetical protein